MSPYLLPQAVECQNDNLPLRLASKATGAPALTATQFVEIAVAYRAHPAAELGPGVSRNVPSRSTPTSGHGRKTEHGGTSARGHDRRCAKHISMPGASRPRRLLDLSGIGREPRASRRARVSTLAPALTPSAHPSAAPPATAPLRAGPASGRRAAARRSHRMIPGLELGPRAAASVSQPAGTANSTLSFLSPPTTVKANLDTSATPGEVSPPTPKNARGNVWSELRESFHLDHRSLVVMIAGRVTLGRRHHAAAPLTVPSR